MRSIIYSVIAVVFMTACSQTATDSKLKQQEKITKLENLVDSIRKTRAASVDEMYELINNYWAYYDANKQDSLSPIFLYRAGESALYINQGIKAISYFKTIESEYADFKNMGSVLFLIGFTYENNVKNFDDARKYYELFLERYPEHPLASDTHILIKNLGKSPEELIREFEAANAKKK
jgi:tetratricopeptide (TPR) repeat protein